MDTEKCKIRLDSPENIYFAGQEIKGEICIILTKKTKIRGICFKINGYGKCNWYELLRRESQGVNQAKGNQRSIIYTSNETYLEHETYIIGSKSAKPIELEAGSHTYPFNYQLQPNLPSSFNGTYGCIKYKLKFIIEKAWNFDDKYSFPITVVKLNPLCTYINRNPVLRQMTKNIGVFGAGPISLIAELPHAEAVRGGKLLLRVTVDNKSNTHVEKLKFSIRQLIKYFSQQPLCIQRDEVFKIYKKETGGVFKKTERTFEHELQVPSCQPTDYSSSKIIYIYYNVHVDVVLPALYKNITVVLPFEICSYEMNAPLPGTGIIAATTITGWNTIYPSPNTSAYSIPSFDQSITSPSHSYAGNYSSSSSHPIQCYSPANTSPSYSFHIMPTNRDESFTNSLPTLPRDSSNRSSISSAGLPQLPGSYPMSTPRTSRLSGMNFSGEMPPSYDELFGNSPETPVNVPTAPPIDMPEK